MKKLLLAVALSIAYSTGCMAQSTGAHTVPGSEIVSGTTGCIIGPCWVPNSQTNPLYTSAGGGTITTITNPVGIKGIDGSTIATGFNPVPVLIAPSASQGVSTQSCTVACASSIVTGGHGLYGLSFSSTVTGWLLIYDATTCSANGTVTPKKVFAYTVANTTMGVSWNNAPMIDTTGTSACFSTTGPFTATSSTTAYISLDYK